MEYKGKLYGHLGGKMYFDTGKNADDWNALEKRVAELEAENQALRQPLVVGRSEQLVCPCCGSDKTYKTDAIHCNRCAVTTEI